MKLYLITIAFFILCSCRESSFDESTEKKQSSATAAQRAVDNDKKSVKATTDEKNEAEKDNPSFCFEGDVPSDIPEEITKSLFKIRAERPVTVIPSLRIVKNRATKRVISLKTWF